MFNNIAEDLWSEFNMDRQPPEPPEWVDILANEVEIGRLVEMGVLVKEELYPSETHLQQSLSMIGEPKTMQWPMVRLPSVGCAEADWWQGSMHSWKSVMIVSALPLAAM